MTPVVLVGWPVEPSAWRVLVEDLGAPGGAERVVVLHGVTPPGPEVVDLLVAALEGVDAVAAGAAVTDAVKVVDVARRVRDEVDRDGLVRLTLPQAVRGGRLLDLGGPVLPPARPTPARQVLAGGGAVRAISVPSAPS